MGIVLVAKVKVSCEHRRLISWSSTGRRAQRNFGGEIVDCQWLAPIRCAHTQRGV